MTRRSVLTSIVITVLLASLRPVIGAEPGPVPAGSPLVYKRVGGRELKLFVEKPDGWKATDHRPAIVFFFGGGWVGGTPNQFLPESEYFARRGMVVIRVEYRTIPKGDQGPPIVCCADAKSAMRYVRSHAADLGVDPWRIAAAGGSAGGHLAAFTGLVNGLDDPQDDLAMSCKPEALVLWNPVYNNGPGNWGHERVGDRYQEFSPAHNITSNAPPTIVFLGTQDKLIPQATAKSFQTEMAHCGVRCETHFYEGQGHGFFNNEPWRSKTLAEADQFLTSLGWLEKPVGKSDPPD
jgi:acetyl esterase/lipase